MILKHADDKTPQIEALKALIQSASGPTKTSLEKELRLLQAGIKGEKEAAYFIDFALKDSGNTAIIHDLRIEVNGRVAQIDHLLVNRTMTFYVLETKHFHSGIKIGEDGQFLKWNAYRKTFEGMPSPLAQNDRHIKVLKELVDGMEWPTRMGVKLTPSFESLVMVSSQSRIDRPKKFDTSRVIKSDELMSALEKITDSMGVVGVFGALAKIVSPETTEEVARAIAACHRPLVPDYRAKFGIVDESEASAKVARPVVQEGKANYRAAHTCRHCKATRLEIRYGRYGYYFKCLDCDGNTPIKLPGCGKGHKVRLRKDGSNFYRECRECRDSGLYFRNP